MIKTTLYSVCLLLFLGACQFEAETSSTKREALSPTKITTEMRVVFYNVENLYDTIDNNPNFKGTTAVEDRSLMNVTFQLTDESKKGAFDKLWNDNGIIGLKGHRSVGGYRASMYNALALDSVKALVEIMNSI